MRFVSCVKNLDKKYVFIDVLLAVILLHVLHGALFIDYTPFVMGSKLGEGLVRGSLIGLGVIAALKVVEKLQN